MTLISRCSRYISWFRPDYRIPAITNLPVGALRARGVLALALDVDHTLAPSRSRQLTPAVIAYCRQLRAAGFTLVIASNARSDLRPLAATLHARLVPASTWRRKPFASYYRQVIAAAGYPPERIAMVGNHPVNDVLGAKAAGLVTVKIARP
ncbi:MAG TPA: HAD family hydrolase [Candidatus Saccharimonadia bacterium]